MSVDKRTIKKVLSKSSKGLKAREIAEILGEDKKEVNSILYKNRDTDFLRDDRYVWTLKKPVRKTTTKRSTKKDTSSKTTAKVEKQATKPVVKQSESKPKLQPSSTPITQEVKSVPSTANFYVAGCWYHRNEIREVIKAPSYQGEYLNDHLAVLEREPNNRYDPNAIKVLVRGNDGLFYLVGYVPKDSTHIYSKYISKHCTADVRRKEDSFTVHITVFKEQERNYTYSERKIISISTPSNNKSTSMSSQSHSGLFRFAAPVVIAGLLFGGINRSRNTATVQTQGSAKPPSVQTQVTEEIPTVYTSRTYNVRGRVRVTSNNSVGSDWSCDIAGIIVNGVEQSTEAVTLHAGDEVYVYGYVVEYDDSYPDSQDFVNASPFIISKGDLQDSFDGSITDIIVTEYGGKYSGNQAIVDAVIIFIPVD